MGENSTYQTLCSWTSTASSGLSLRETLNLNWNDPGADVKHSQSASVRVDVGGESRPSVFPWGCREGPAPSIPPPESPQRNTQISEKGELS